MRLFNRFATFFCAVLLASSPGMRLDAHARGNWRVS